MKKKQNLPPSIGAELKRSNPSPRPFDYTDDSGRDAVLVFHKKYDALLKSVTDAIGIMIANRAGNEMLLMDAALLGVLGYLRDAIARQGVRVAPDAKGMQ